MTQIWVSFSAFFTIFVNFWPILTQYFELYCIKIMSRVFFGTTVTPLASPETSTNEKLNLPASQDEQPKEQPVTINIPMVTPIDRTMQVS